MGAGEGDFGGERAAAVRAALCIAENFLHPAIGVYQAGHAVVGAAEQGHAVLHRAKYRIGHVLPLLRACSKPAVVGQVHKEIKIGLGGVPGRAGKRVLKANQRGAVNSAGVGHLRRGGNLNGPCGRCLRSGEGERHGAVTRRPAALDGRQPFQERQPVGQRHVFTEDDQFTLVVSRIPSAIRSHQKRGVEIVGDGGVKFHILCVQNQPEVVGARESADGKKSRLIHRRYGGFRPNQQISSVRQRPL